MIEAAGKLRDDEALWRFSAAFYARPGVSEALVALQDRAGWDVNLMLYALWLGVCQGGRLTKEGLAIAEQVAQPIRTDIVEPLRALRRKLRADPAADVQSLRDGIKKLELDAEKAIQVRLGRIQRSARTGVGPAARSAAARANLARYLGPDMARSPEAAAIGEALEAFIRD